MGYPMFHFVAVLHDFEGPQVASKHPKTERSPSYKAVEAALLPS